MKALVAMMAALVGVGLILGAGYLAYRIAGSPALAYEPVTLERVY